MKRCHFDLRLLYERVARKNLPLRGLLIKLSIVRYLKIIISTNFDLKIDSCSIYSYLENEIVP